MKVIILDVFVRKNGIQFVVVVVKHMEISVEHNVMDLMNNNIH